MYFSKYIYCALIHRWHLPEIMAMLWHYNIFLPIFVAILIIQDRRYDANDIIATNQL